MRQTRAATRETRENLGIPYDSSLKFYVRYELMDHGTVMDICEGLEKKYEQEFNVFRWFTPEAISEGGIVFGNNPYMKHDTVLQYNHVNQPYVSFAPYKSFRFGIKDWPLIKKDVRNAWKNEEADHYFDTEPCNELTKTDQHILNTRNKGRGNILTTVFKSSHGASPWTQKEVNIFISVLQNNEWQLIGSPIPSEIRT